MHLSRDINGNKILVITTRDLNYRGRGFSVQTLGNLPQTHKMQDSDFNDHIAYSELLNYVREFGTARQKTLLNVE